MSKYRNEAVMNLYQEPEDSILKSSSEVSVKRFSLSRFLFITGGCHCIFDIYDAGNVSGKSPSVRRLFV